MFREVSMPGPVKGRLYCHSMPGRFEPLDETIELIQMKCIRRLVSLTSVEEINSKSPSYARLLRSGEFEWEQEAFPVADFGIPSDRGAFLAFVTGVARRLEDGDNVLLHCGAGVGRTGTAAMCVLLVLGLSRPQARTHVSRAGAGPETASQEELVTWVEKRVSGSLER